MADSFDEKEPQPKLFKALKYRSIGPGAGGRVCRVAGEPGNPLVFYAATASGGIWKTYDGGFRWHPIFDETDQFTVGSIAIAPSNPNIIYAGTGEANIRGNVCSGDGIYKSLDAGKSWKHIWKQKGQIGTMIVHPTNPDIAFAAVLGHAFGPNSDRGVFRTTDGGINWQKVLYKDDESGASDVCFDPSNPNILFAGLWQTRRRPWDLTSGGPGSGLYVSRDGGTTWKQLKHKNDLDKETGLPEGIWGKVGVAVAASDGNRVYALIEAEKGGLYRSDDGGVKWHLENGDHRLRQRAWYYTTITIDPTNADILYCPQVPMLKSIDGGKSFMNVSGLHHGDNHDTWIDPKNPKRMIIGNDGGVDLSFDGGRTWYAPPLPISQFYHINIDTRTPCHVGGTMQDLGTAAAPVNTLAFPGIRLADWYPIGGGETGYVYFDPRDPNIIYAGEYGGTITRYDHRTKSARNVSIYPDNPSGHGGEDMKYRFRWPAPIAGSPHDPSIVYHGGNLLFRTKDGGKTWEAISPDLTRNDKSKQKWSGGPITGDNTTAEYYCTLSAIAESPKQAGLIWVGSDDGLVHVTKDHGKTWDNVTSKMPSFPEWGTIKMIEASRYDAGTAYVVVDAHMLDDTRPYLFKTKDFGQTWEALHGKLPTEKHLHVVREDSVKNDLLFVGTERSVQMSRDGGKNWERLKLNFPPCPVHDLIVNGNELIVGTNGRSIWVLDDISPLRTMTADKTDQALLMLEPQPATRWRMGASSVSSHDFATFPNPDYGAVLHYFFKKKPEKDIKLEIRDAAGNLIIEFESKKESAKDKKEAEEEKEQMKEVEEEEERPDRHEKPKLPKEEGLNRFVWDLSHEGGKKIKGAVADQGSPETRMLINPGTYTAKLTADGKDVTAKITVQPDPRLNVKPEQLAEQEKNVLAMRTDLNTLTQTVTTVRALRSQLQARNALLKDEEPMKKLVDASKKAIEALDKLEERLHNPKAKIPYDVLAMKGGAKLYSRLVFLYEAALDGEGGPTQGEMEVYIQLKEELKKCLQDFETFKTKDLAELNQQAKQLDVPTIYVPKPKEEKK